MNFKQFSDLIYVDGHEDLPVVMPNPKGDGVVPVKGFAMKGLKNKKNTDSQAIVVMLVEPELDPEKQFIALVK